MKERLRTKLSHFSHWDWDIETRYIRTQHSLSWGYIRNDYKLISWREWKEFLDKYRWKINWKDSDEDIFTSYMGGEFDSVDESVWRAINLGRLTCQHPGNLLEFQRERPILERLMNDYTAWKNENGYIDFIGMIEQAIQREVVPHGVTHIFVDEAQDMCPLLYEYHKVLYKSLPNAEIRWYADEDQCVYKFMGADPKIFVNQPAIETVYGENSYRLPENVATYAHGIISRNKERLPKLVIGQEKPGSQWKEFSILTAAQTLENLKPTGTVLWLTATNFQAKEARDELQANGFPVKPDAEMRSMVALAKLITESPPRLKKYALEAIKNARLDGKKIFPFTKLWWDQPHKMSERITAILESPNDESIPIDDPMIGLRLQQILKKKDWHLIFDDSPDSEKIILRIEGCLNASQKDLGYEIEISTFHRSKGREANQVVVCTDLKGKMLESVYQDVEAGRRLFFVAVTRTKSDLIFYRNDWKRGVDWEEAVK